MREIFSIFGESDPLVLLYQAASADLPVDYSGMPRLLSPDEATATSSLLDLSTSAPAPQSEPEVVSSITIETSDERAEQRACELLMTCARENTPLRVQSSISGIDFVMDEFADDAGFRVWWKGGGFYYFWIDSKTLRLVPGDVLTVTRTTSLPDPIPTQFFAEGISHCLLGPIRNWAQEKLDGASSRSAKCTYRGIITRVDEFISQYTDGVPEDAIGTICDSLRIDINIQNPFSTQIYINGRSQKRRICKFSFMNTRLNHVDKITNTLSSDAVTVDREFLNNKIKELNESGVFYTFRKDNEGVCAVNTLDHIYKCDSEHAKLVSKFEKGYKINEFKIDAINNKAVYDFCSAGIHRNMSNFVAIEHSDVSGLESLDIRSSFANVHQSKFYDGFPTKITDMRPCHKIEGPGVYRIRNLDWSLANPKFAQLSQLLGDIYNSDTVYPVPDLIMLSHYGVKFEIVEGAWAGGQTSSFDFRYPGNRDDETDFFAKDGTGVRHYARWVGGLVSNNRTNRVWVRGEPGYFSQIQSMYPECSARHYQSIDGSMGEGYIEFRRQYAYGLPTLVSYTEAYERTIIIEQLMLMDTSKVVSIQKDSINFYPHEFEKLDVMTPKTPMVIEFGSNCYLTNLPLSRTTDPSEKRSIQLTIPEVMIVTSAKERAQYPVESNIGVGGGGKTHRNLTDAGFIRPIYISPSWKLAREKRRKYKCPSTVHARAISVDPEQHRPILSSNVILWD